MTVDPEVIEANEAFPVCPACGDTVLKAKTDIEAGRVILKSLKCKACGFDALAAYRASKTA